MNQVASSVDFPSKLYGANSYHSSYPKNVKTSIFTSVWSGFSNRFILPNPKILSISYDDTINQQALVSMEALKHHVIRQTINFLFYYSSM